MALKKVSINEKQINKLQELLSKNVPIYKIAIKLKLSNSTVLRNANLLGLNYKYKRKPKTEIETEIFDWKEFKNNYKY